MLRILLLSTFCLTLFQQLGATDKYWVGGTIGSWDEPNNWSPTGVPTAVDDVLLFCDCIVKINGGYVAVAASVLVYNDVTLTVSSNSSLEIQPTLYYGLQIAGSLNNWGTVSVRNPNSNVNQGVIVEDGGRLNCWGDLNVSYAVTGIVISGQLVSWGNINVNEAATTQQTRGIHVNTGGYVVLHGNVSINYTDFIGFGAIHGTTVISYADITVENSCTGRGFVNDGSFSNQGRIFVRGATTNGFYNSGSLDNTGELRFYHTASGDALYSNGGDITNHSSGLIYVYGSQYEHGIRFTGGNRHFYNHGFIDVYTGQHVANSLYFNWDTELINTANGVIKVRTYATTALRFNGNEFNNSGGLVELECYGPDKNSLRLGNGATVNNWNCGTITLEDRLTLGTDAELINSAWLELMNDNEPYFYPGSQLANGGVIYDRSGALENVDFSHIYNDEGVIVTAPTDAIVFGDPYTDYILAGPYTDVEINDVITDGSIQIGDYDESGAAVYFDESTYNHPKYFYAEFNIPGCDNRSYRVYNNTPAPPKSPVFGGGNNWEYDGQRTGGQALDLKVGSIEAFPNPASQVLNLRLSAEFQGELQLELRDLHGRSVLTNRQTAAPQLSLDRPANLPGGTYLLTITDTAGEVVTKRVIFQ